MKQLSICILPLLFVSTQGQAQGPIDIKKVTASVDGEYLSYSGPHGSRRIVNGETRADLGKSKLSFGIAQGQRTAGDNKFRGTRVSAAVVRDWNRRISTRTSASIATNSPIFAKRDLAQDVSFKLMPQTLLTVGARHTRYFGDVTAVSLSAGAAQYFRGGFVSYRYSSYDIKGLGRSPAHLLSARLEDPYGSSQLWLGHGESLQDLDWLASPHSGKSSRVELRRVHKIGGGVGLVVGLSKGWHDAGSGNFKSTGARLGLTFEK